MHKLLAATAVVAAAIAAFPHPASAAAGCADKHLTAASEQVRAFQPGVRRLRLCSVASGVSRTLKAGSGNTVEVVELAGTQVVYLFDKPDRLEYRVLNTADGAERVLGVQKASGKGPFYTDFILRPSGVVAYERGTSGELADVLLSKPGDAAPAVLAEDAETGSLGVGANAVFWMKDGVHSALVGDEATATPAPKRLGAADKRHPCATQGPGVLAADGSSRLIHAGSSAYFCADRGIRSKVGRYEGSRIVRAGAFEYANFPSLLFERITPDGAQYGVVEGVDGGVEILARTDEQRAAVARHLLDDNGLVVGYESLGASPGPSTIVRVSPGGKSRTLASGDLDPASLAVDEFEFRVYWTATDGSPRTRKL